MKHLTLLGLFVPLLLSDGGPSSLSCDGGPLWPAAYCGKYTSVSPPPPTACIPGGSSWPTCADLATCALYVAPTGGSDSNPGTSALPLATLGRAQTLARAAPPAPARVVCLKAGSGGSYNNVSLSFTAADASETWQADPASGLDTAILDGTNTTGNAFSFDGGANNVKINGIRLTRYTTHPVEIYNSNGGTVENCEVDNMNTAPPVEAAFNVGGVVTGNAQNVTINNNYFHDLASEAVELSAYTAGQSVNGTVITANVALRTALQSSDIGVIGAGQHNNPGQFDNVTISNNFIRDWGASGFDNMRAIYLDDASAGITVSGNIIGPPSVGVNATFIDSVFTNGGDRNNFQNNIIDIGNYGSAFIIWPENGPVVGGALNYTWVGPNAFQNNIILANGSVTNGGYSQNSTQLPSTIRNNLYFNYGSGFISSSGNQTSDSSPQRANPLCTGYLYTLAANSPAFSLISFVDVSAARKAGPPSQGATVFVIPTSTNHSTP